MFGDADQRLVIELLDFPLAQGMFHVPGVDVIEEAPDVVAVARNPETFFVSNSVVLEVFHK